MCTRARGGVCSCTWPGTVNCRQCFPTETQFETRSSLWIQIDQDKLVHLHPRRKKPHQLYVMMMEATWKQAEPPADGSISPTETHKCNLLSCNVCNHSWGVLGPSQWIKTVCTTQSSFLCSHTSFYTFILPWNWRKLFLSLWSPLTGSNLISWLLFHIRHQGVTIDILPFL